MTYENGWHSAEDCTPMTQCDVLVITASTSVRQNEKAFAKMGQAELVTFDPNTPHRMWDIPSWKRVVFWRHVPDFKAEPGFGVDGEPFLWYARRDLGPMPMGCVRRAAI